MNPRDWHEMMREEIKKEYLRQYVLGRGGKGSMTQADWGSVGGMLIEQYHGTKKHKGLDGFYAAVKAGDLSEDQIRARAAMYVNSAREGFERGQARAFGIPLDKLPMIPGRGDTQCLTNCACSWEFVAVYDETAEGTVLVGWDCYWTLGIVKTEHCPDCLENAGKWNPLFVGTGGEVVEGPVKPTPESPLDTEIAGKQAEIEQLKQQIKEINEVTAAAMEAGDIEKAEGEITY